MQDYFEAIREACSSHTWSRGVELVREGAVTGDREEEGEVHLRVAARGDLVAPNVVLYLDDEDWECSCAGEADPCEHVAAATIALRRARKEGQSLPEAEEAPARIRYCFQRSPDGLVLEREILRGDEAEPLTTTLDALASGRVQGPRIAADQRDLKVEITLGSRRSGVLPRELLARVVDALAGSELVLLDREPIEVSSERVLPHVLLEDVDGGFRLSLSPDPEITETFREGAVLCERTLRVAGPARLTGRERATLPSGQFYSNDQVAFLATEVLPDLEARLPVEILTDRLPSTTRRERPRIRLAVEREEDRLRVLPTLVYGDPPTARIDAGELVHLEGAIPVRDVAAERRELARLRSELELSPGRWAEFRGEEALQFAGTLDAWRGDVEGDAHRGFYCAADLDAQLRVSGRRLDVGFEAAAADGGGGRRARASASSVLAAWREGESIVPLESGGFARLPVDWLERYGHRVAALLEARNDNDELPTHALPQLALLCDDLETPRPPELDALRPLIDDFDGIPEARLPEGLRADLRGYQRRGVDWLAFLREARLGALLADDMGLGKTLQSLCVLGSESLVVAPTSVLHNWVEEIERFRPDLRHHLYHGPGRVLSSDADVTLTSYAILRLDAELLGERAWQCVVLDEAQSIKNPDSQVAQAAYRLRAPFRMALTGTPVENRLDELWSQFHFLNRGLLGGRSEFRERFARPIADGDPSAAERLRERIRPFVLRRLKTEVAPELPPRTEVVLHVELSEEEREVYESIRASTVAQVVERLRAGGNVMAALEALLRLRQAACHAGLVPGQEAQSSSKVEALVDRLEQAVADGHKALVFSQWTELLDRVEPALRQAELTFTRLDGSTRDRAGVISEFQNEDGPPLMLVSLKAGGTGVNLTAADHIFILDPWWNPAVEDQAADRAHRIGQTRPVVIHRLVSLDTVEERILLLHEAKRALSRMALEEAGQSGGLTRDDLLGLLADA